MEEKILVALYEMITPAKIEKFERIAAERTDYITMVVENLYQEHNASAVMRSCDCFGIQNLPIIENDNQFTVNNDIAKSAGK
jgi:tRNA (guanosine-2'-O-)-methyltransferase